MQEAKFEKFLKNLSASMAYLCGRESDRMYCEHIFQNNAFGDGKEGTLPPTFSFGPQTPNIPISARSEDEWSAVLDKELGYTEMVRCRW